MRRTQLQRLFRYDSKTGIFYAFATNTVIGTTHSDGYIYLWIDGNKRRADKVAWFLITGVWPKKNIIHLDGVKTHNWADNLREEKKIRKRKDNKSFITGVCQDKNRFRAYITVDKKRLDLGSYKDFDGAVAARYTAEKQYFMDTNSLASIYVKNMFI